MMMAFQVYSFLEQHVLSFLRDLSDRRQRSSLAESISMSWCIYSLAAYLNMFIFWASVCVCLFILERNQWLCLGAHGAETQQLMGMRWRLLLRKWSQDWCWRHCSPVDIANPCLCGFLPLFHQHGHFWRWGNTLHFWISMAEICGENQT